VPKIEIRYLRTIIQYILKRNTKRENHTYTYHEDHVMQLLLAFMQGTLKLLWAFVQGNNMHLAEKQKAKYYPITISHQHVTCSLWISCVSTHICIHTRNDIVWSIFLSCPRMTCLMMTLTSLYRPSMSNHLLLGSYPNPLK
jgi:hypothetical protein